jgi:hypothetical protein
MQPWNPDSGNKPKSSLEGFGGLTPDPSVMAPNVRTKIEDFLRQMDDSGGMFPWNDFDKYLGRPGSRPEDRIMDGPPPGRGWPKGGTTLGPEYEGTYKPGPSTTMMGRNPDGTPITFDNPRITQGQATPPMQTPPADVPTPPLEKTLEQRVWERDQMPKRTPDAQGRLYPDKNDPDFLDPRITKEGFKTMQYIPELDDPNWTPWGGRSTLFDRASPLGGGEGIQYRL